MLLVLLAFLADLDYSLVLVVMDCVHSRAWPIVLKLVCDPNGPRVVRFYPLRLKVLDDFNT